MATKYTDLPAADLPLTGAEIIAVVQDGDSKQTTTQDIADLGGGGPGATTEHVTKNANFIVSTADTRKTYVIDSASPVTAQLPDLSAEVVDYEWGIIVINTGGGDIDINGQPAESSNGVDFDFADINVQMYLYYNSEEGVYYFQNGTAGAAVTPTLQEVLDEGSSATIATNMHIQAVDVIIGSETTQQTRVENADGGSITITEKVEITGSETNIAGGNLTMSSNKITGLAAGAAAGEALRYEQGPNGFPVVDTTGTAISFAVPQTYGTDGAPETGNITIVTTGLVKGMTQLLIHNNGSEPTYGAEIKIISGAYVTGENNYIMLMAVSTTLILVTIAQEI